MEVSSLLSLEVDGLARPTNIRAMVTGDTLASGIIPSGINRAASGVNVSSTLWNIVYTQVQASAGYWNVAAGVADLSYISGVINSVSATAANSSSILNASSGIWNGTYETVLANSATWGGISDASSLRGSPLSATLVPSAGQSLVYDGSVWTASTVVATGGGGGGGVTDHGALTGLADDDHPQYVLSATNNALSSLVNNHIASAVHWDIATLNNNYINASGDSANAAFFFQTLSATTVSATTYLNIRPNVSSVNSAATTSFTAGGDYDTYLINTTTTSVIAYLPEASSYTNKRITFSKVDDGGSYRSVTVSGAQLVTATNTVVLYDPTESVTVISNGTNWYSLDYDRSYGVVFVCKNSTGATLTKGTPVRVSGATGANVLITPASAVNNAVPESLSGFLARVIGVVEHDIPDGEFGHVLTKGSLYKYNTDAFNEGDALYLAASGGLTNIKPTPPYEEIFIGIVTRKQTNNGSILVDIQNPEHINSIVGFNLASSISERDVIAYDLTTSTFKNYNPSSFNVSSATSATLALSATSALNAQQAPNGFTVTGTLTATTASATTYLNLPSSIATWNASALQGKTLNAASPTINEILRYNGTQWINDSETQYSLNGELGAGWTINAASGINFTNTATNTFRITANYTSGIWNASALQGSPLSANLVPTTNQGLVYNGSVWTASSINDVTNAVNATSATNAFSSTYAYSSTLALSATSALNAQQAPNGFNVTGTLRSPTVSATNVSATGTITGDTVSAFNYLGIDHTLIGSIGSNSHDTIDLHLADTNNPHSVTAEQVGNYTAQWNASAIRSSPLSATLVPTAGQALMYNGSVWTASAALFAYSYGSGAPTGGSDGDIYLQTDVEALQVATVSATTYLNLPSSVITWTNATSATNAFSSTYAFSATNALSSTNAFSSTYALSATSALNAQQAPNGFTVTGTLSSTNLLTTSGDVSAVRLTDYSERKSAPTISSSSLTLDLNAAQVFTVSLNSNISTLTISNTESRANSVQGFTLILTADGTARTITWPGSVKWPSGTGPTLTSTNNKVDILSFVSPDNGTTWYGFVGGQNY